MLSIVMPVFNAPEMTNECIDNLEQHATGDLDIIVVDNGSPQPFHRDKVRTIYNDRNVGFWPAMLQGIEIAHSDIIMCMHNDVLIWEYNYDGRILTHFSKDYLLGLAGLFGGRGVGVDGGRGHPESNMLGKKYGTHGSMHGHILTGSHPAVVFDSLCMIVRKRHLELLDYKNIPPYHWTDRILSLDMVTSGLHALTIGIGFDHGGGYTSSKIGPSNNFMKEWSESKGLPMLENWDMTVYDYGRRMFEQKFRVALQNPTVKTLWVNEAYQYKVGT
jgi:hypothetical protein